MATNKEKVLEIVNSANHRRPLDIYNGYASTIEPGCNDEMIFFINVNDRKIITDVGFMINDSACAPVVAAAEVASRMIEGKPVLAAYTINHKKIADVFSDGEISVEHLHCVLMAEITVKKAVVDYSKK